MGAAPVTPAGPPESALVGGGPPRRRRVTLPDAARRRSVKHQLGGALISLPESNRDLAVLLLRIITGINFVGHGLVRILGDYTAFAQGIVDQFADTILPAVMVWPLGYAIPVVELAFGVALIVGVRIRATVIAGFVLMAVLLSGMVLLEEWAVVGIQMIYILTLFAILAFQPEARHGPPDPPSANR